MLQLQGLVWHMGPTWNGGAADAVHLVLNSAYKHLHADDQPRLCRLTAGLWLGTSVVSVKADCGCKQKLSALPPRCACQLMQVML